MALKVRVVVINGNKSKEMGDPWSENISYTPQLNHRLCLRLKTSERNRLTPGKICLQVGVGSAYQKLNLPFIWLTTNPLKISIGPFRRLQFF